MHATKVTDDTYLLSVNVENILFEGLWEIPNGVALNSYIVKGEKLPLLTVYAAGKVYLKSCINFWMNFKLILCPSNT